MDEMGWKLKIKSRSSKALSIVYSVIRFHPWLWQRNIGLNLHYNVIVAKFVANKSLATDGCPFMQFRWILVEEIHSE
jgi:hypothetical protein